jgi:hypothetical protein
MPIVVIKKNDSVLIELEYHRMSRLAFHSFCFFFNACTCSKPLIISCNYIKLITYINWSKIAENNRGRVFKKKTMQPPS